MTRKIFFYVLILTHCYGYGQYLTRKNYGALLEPNNRIFSGAGQSNDAFDSFWSEMPAGSKPVLYMTYIGLKNVSSDWYLGLEKELDKHGDTLLIPQIGLSMTTDGEPSSHYEGEVPTGKYDEQMQWLIDGIKKMGRPAFIRIGYEFNGLVWNGYNASTYVQAYRYITNKLRAQLDEVATVWCFAVDGDADFKPFYPGDSYVDWCGIDLFGVDHFSHTKTNQFMHFSDSIGKPVMIGESTPRGVGVLDGATSWNNWFVPFFTFIKNNPGVKAFCYINWNWAAYPQWSSWGDARIQENLYVAEHFRGEMDSVLLLNALPQNQFRHILYPSDTTSPSWTPSLVYLGGTYPFYFRWNRASDSSGISHYRVFRDNDLLDCTMDTLWYDYMLGAGETYTYRFAVMDKAGNETHAADSFVITYPDTIQKIMNPSFNEGDKNWNLSLYDANSLALFDFDSSLALYDKYAAYFSMIMVSGTDWHIQFTQRVYMHNGKKYNIRCQSKADGDAVVKLIVQLDGSPYSVFKWNTLNLTSSPGIYNISGTFSLPSSVYKAGIALGSTTAFDVWLDNFTLEEINLPVTERSMVEGKSLVIFPNPCHDELNLNVEVEQDARYSILSMEGVLLAEGKVIQDHPVSTGFLSPGFYLIRLLQGDREYVGGFVKR